MTQSDQRVTRSELQRMIREALGVARDESIELREAEKRHAAREVNEAFDDGMLKGERKQWSKHFESQGMPKDRAERVAQGFVEGGWRPDTRIAAIKLSEGEVTRLQETWQRADEARRESTAHLEDDAEVFRTLGLSESAAKFAARGR